MGITFSIILTFTLAIQKAWAECDEHIVDAYIHQHFLLGSVPAQEGVMNEVPGSTGFGFRGLCSIDKPGISVGVGLEQRTYKYKRTLSKNTQEYSAESQMGTVYVGYKFNKAEKSHSEIAVIYGKGSLNFLGQQGQTRLDSQSIGGEVNHRGNLYEINHSKVLYNLGVGMFSTHVNDFDYGDQHFNSSDFRGSLYLSVGISLSF